MKRWTGLLLCIIILSAALCGCSSYVALEDRAFVMAIGADWEEGAYRISYAFPDLATLTGNQKGGYEEPMTFQANDLEASRRKYEALGNRSIDYGQTKVLILGQSLLDNEEALKKLFQEMTKNPQFARTILLCGTNGKAEDIIKLDGEVDGSVGIYIEQLFRNNGEKLGYETVILNDVSGIEDKETMQKLDIPMIKIAEKKPSLNGTFSIFALAQQRMSLYTVD